MDERVVCDIEDIKARVEARIGSLRNQLDGYDAKKAELEYLVAAQAALGAGAALPRAAPKRGPDKAPRKRAALGKGMPETPTPAPEQTISTGVAGATDLGDKDVAKAMSATWCRRSSADLNDKTCARMQREGGHLCTAGCARKTKSTG